MTITRNEKEIKYANLKPEEKQKLLKRCYDIIMQLQFSGNSNSVITFNVQAPHVIRVRIDGKKLKYYNNMYLNKYATEEEKKQYQAYCDILKQCYTIFMSTKGNPSQREAIAEIQGLNYSKQKILQLARKYCYMIKGMSQEELVKKFRLSSKYDRMLRKVSQIPLDNDAEIISLLQKAHKRDKTLIQFLKLRIPGFVMSEYSELSIEDKNRLQQELLKKFSIMKKSAQDAKKQVHEKEKAKKEQKLLPTAKKTLESFINSDLNIEQFVKENSMTVSEFRKYLLILQKYEPDQYEKYTNRNQNRQEQCFHENIKVVQLLLFYLKYGMPLEDDIRKPFDLLDYYLYFGISIDAVQRCIKYNGSTIDKCDYTLLRQFLPQDDRTLIPLNVDQTLASTHEVNAQKDEKGWPIAGTGRIITIEEKQDVINFLITSNVPLTTKLYDIALKRYVDGTLYKIEGSNEQSKSLQLVKKVTFK